MGVWGVWVLSALWVKFYLLVNLRSINKLGKLGCLSVGKLDRCKDSFGATDLQSKTHSALVKAHVVQQLMRTKKASKSMRKVEEVCAISKESVLRDSCANLHLNRPSIFHTKTNR